MDRVAHEAVGDLTHEAREARLVRSDPDGDVGAKGRGERSLELAEVVPVVVPLEPLELTGVAVGDDQADELDGLAEVGERLAVARHSIDVLHPHPRAGSEAEHEPSVRQAVEVDRCHRRLEGAAGVGDGDAAAELHALGHCRAVPEGHERHAIDLRAEDPRQTGGFDLLRLGGQDRPWHVRHQRGPLSAVVVFHVVASFLLSSFMSSPRATA